MQVRFVAARPEGSYTLALPIVGAPPADGGFAGFDAETAETIRRAAAAARFSGDAASVAEIYLPEGDIARRVLLVGVAAGEPSQGDLEKLGATLAARLLTSGETRLVIDISTLALGDKAARAAVAVAEGAVLRSWRHDVYRTRLSEKQKSTLVEIEVVGGGAGADALWADRAAVVDGVSLARELVTEPANILYPQSFIDRVRPQLEAIGVQIEVVDEVMMRSLGMGALLGVGQGSTRPPRLLAMRWDGTGGAQATPLALVGKGVTFDTGGISIKPAAGMEDMKWDMGGAAAVTGAMRALAGRKAKVHVVGICGLVENMPDGNAQRPGDVVTSMSGQTIEVINTDAEGRLVLADAITWVQQRHRPKVIVDLATLTGAMIISLAHEYGGVFANDDALADQLLAAGDSSGDRLWRMPLGDAFDKMIDSPIADMKNVGPREGGSITAAQFIKRYVDDGVRWAHLDIAGMVWASKPGATWEKGATGYGVRLLERFVAENFEG